MLFGTVSWDAINNGPKNGSLSASVGKPNIASKPKAENRGYTHCGNIKHTCETCFKLYRYPEWWDEFKDQKQREATINGGSG